MIGLQKFFFVLISSFKQIMLSSSVKFGSDLIQLLMLCRCSFVLITVLVIL